MASDRIFDVAVIGLGAVGSASLYQFARRGHRVLGLDRWNPPHSLGSSHGSTRITRCAVGEGDGYVPLVRRTHQIWREIEADTGQDLLTQCGALVIAAPGNAPTVHGKQDFFRRTVEVARRNAVPHDLLDAVEVRRRFPQFQLADDEMAFFEPSGGYVRPERCIAAQLGLATQLGAQVRPNMHVTQLARSGAGVRITTAGGDWFEAAEGRAGGRSLVAQARRPGRQPVDDPDPPGPPLVRTARGSVFLAPTVARSTSGCMATEPRTASTAFRSFPGIAT